MEPSSAPWRIVDTAEPSSPPEERGRGRPWLAIAALLAAVAVGSGALLFAARPTPGVDVGGTAIAEAGAAGQGGSASAGPAPATRLLVVEVAGAVTRPGVYRLPTGSRIGDAIAAAGGFGPRVDVAAADQQLNLAAPLADGQKVHVPARGESATSGSGVPPGGSRAPGGLVDLNRATAAELDALPGVGPTTAAKIIAGRPYTSIADLTDRKVIGSSLLAKIRDLVTVGG